MEIRDLVSGDSTWSNRWEHSILTWISVQLIDADGAHDLAHVQRVVTNACRLMKSEQANRMVVLPAAWLHDCVVVPKDSPNRHQASRQAAAKAKDFLLQLDYPPQFMPAIVHAIEAHSFSAGIVPQTIEAKVVQDADRLDALGAIGLARCFLTAGATGTELYDPAEPVASGRPLDDRRFAVDHFFKKLLLLPQQMQTTSGRNLASERAQFLMTFLKQMALEAGWDASALASQLERVKLADLAKR